MSIWRQQWDLNNLHIYIYIFIHIIHWMKTNKHVDFIQWLGFYFPLLQTIFPVLKMISSIATLRSLVIWVWYPYRGPQTFSLLVFAMALIGSIDLPHTIDNHSINKLDIIPGHVAGLIACIPHYNEHYEHSFGPSFIFKQSSRKKITGAKFLLSNALKSLNNIQQIGFCWENLNRKP